jgi:hypothetical protein
VQIEAYQVLKSSHRGNLQLTILLGRPCTNQILPKSTKWASVSRDILIKRTRRVA